MADFKVILWYIFVIIVCVLGVATSSMSLQCYNDNPSYFPSKNEDLRKSNYMYTVINLTLLIVILIGSVIGIVTSFT
jgi:hypothetical protein